MLTQARLVTTVNVDNAVKVYHRMKAASERRKQVIAEVVEDLKALADGMDAGINVVNHSTILRRLVSKLENA